MLEAWAPSQLPLAAASFPGSCDIARGKWGKRLSSQKGSLRWRHQLSSTAALLLPLLPAVPGAEETRREAGALADSQNRQGEDGWMDG